MTASRHTTVAPRMTGQVRGPVYAGLALALMLVARVYGAELEPFEASYAWSWKGMTVAVSTVKLEQDQGLWHYRSHSSPRGIGKVFAERPLMESTLRVTADGVQPISYRADDGTSSTKRDAQLNFDWEHGRVTGVYEDVPVDLPLQPGIQDDLSIQIALMVELLRGHTPQQFQLVDRNQVREYQYSRAGTETLHSALGDVQTIIYQAQKASSPRITRFWCAPSLGFVPLRVEQRRQDDVQWTMQIEKLQRQVLGSVTPN